MVDFLIDLCAEVADFFVTFWVDHVVDKCSKRKRKT